MDSDDGTLVADEEDELMETEKSENTKF